MSLEHCTNRYWYTFTSLAVAMALFKREVYGHLYRSGLTDSHREKLLTVTCDIRLQWTTSASRRITSAESRFISCCDHNTSLRSISSPWKPWCEPVGRDRKEPAVEVDVEEAVVTGRTAEPRDADCAECCSFWTSSWSPLWRALRWLISTWTKKVTKTTHYRKKILNIDVALYLFNFWTRQQKLITDKYSDKPQNFTYIFLLQMHPVLWRLPFNLDLGCLQFLFELSVKPLQALILQQEEQQPEMNKAEKSSE